YDNTIIIALIKDSYRGNCSNTNSSHLKVCPLACLEDRDMPILHFARRQSFTTDDAWLPRRN
ncbi:hypothetical protein SK128_023862, partial [Halocaridina rubra]